MDKVVLITGANGFVGRNLIARLSRRTDLTIIGADLQETFVSHDGNCPPKFVYESIDISRGVSVGQLADQYRFDAIIHLAAILSKDEDPGTHARVLDGNVGATLNVLEAARMHSSHFLFPSTGLVYGNRPGPFTEEMTCEPVGFYAISKYLGEELVRHFGRQYGIAHTIFRIAILYGPGQTGTMFVPSLIRNLLAGREFAMTRGEQTRDFVFINDFTRAIELAIDKPLTGVFNVGSGNEISMVDAARVAAQQIAREGLLRIGALPYRPNESWTYCLSPEKLAKRSGWSTQYDLKTGLERVIGHLRKELD